MIGMATSLLFAGTALLVLVALTTSWRQYGGQMLALRGELQRCPKVRIVQYRIAESGMRSQRHPARIIALPVRPKALHPSADGWRAAA